VPGRPQSATGQAALLTGRNVPREIGQHYGPKPTPEIAAILNNGNLFCRVHRMGGRAAFLNPYPPQFFEGIRSGRRLLSAFPLAATAAGLSLLTEKELSAGRAVSPDLTGEGWRRQLGFETMPLLTAYQAGERMAHLAKEVQFTVYEHWPTDFAGHRREWDRAVELIEKLDAMVGGIVAHWRPEDGLVLISSDHGNLEDLSVRTHTMNPVPTILIGGRHAQWVQQIQDLTDVKPVLLDALGDAEDIAEKQ
jgi:2,3-bisphosphoglycerate-independent phosphoglycerate mutase